jgi:hypothetical protein
VIHFINKPMPGGLPKRTSRALLDIEDDTVVPDHPRPGEGHGRFGGGVLLPGLRLGAAVLARWGSPRRRCSTTSARRRAAAGLPVLRLSADAGGQPRQGRGITHRNRVLFHRVANTLNYLDIKTVIVSCGTCMDQLLNTSSRRSSRAAACSTSTST